MKAYLVMLALLWEIQSITFVFRKKNINIPMDLQYINTVEIRRQNAELIPINMSIQTSISSTIPSYNSYFDYFYFLTPPDLQCYHESVNNRSYLFPCAFINNRNTLKRTSFVQNQQFNQSIQDINDLTFSFIIDNTLFPYPSGAYDYSPINLDVQIQVNINVSPSYQTLGTRLIFISVTVFLIFLTIIGCLVFKTRALSKQMQSSNLTQNQINRLESVANHEESQSSQSQKDQDSERELREKFLQPGDQEIIEEQLEQHQETRRSGLNHSHFSKGSFIKQQ